MCSLQQCRISTPCARLTGCCLLSDVLNQFPMCIPTPFFRSAGGQSSTPTPRPPLAALVCAQTALICTHSSSCRSARGQSSTPTSRRLLTAALHTDNGSHAFFGCLQKRTWAEFDAYFQAAGLDDLVQYTAKRRYDEHCQVSAEGSGCSCGVIAFHPFSSALARHPIVYLKLTNQSPIPTDRKPLCRCWRSWCRAWLRTTRPPRRTLSLPRCACFVGTNTWLPLYFQPPATCVHRSAFKLAGNAFSVCASTVLPCIQSTAGQGEEG